VGANDVLADAIRRNWGREENFLSAITTGAILRGHCLDCEHPTGHDKFESGELLLRITPKTHECASRDPARVRRILPQVFLLSQECLLAYVGEFEASHKLAQVSFVSREVDSFDGFILMLPHCMVPKQDGNALPPGNLVDNIPFLLSKSKFRAISKDSSETGPKGKRARCCCFQLSNAKGKRTLYAFCLSCRLHVDGLFHYAPASCRNLSLQPGGSKVTWLLASPDVLKPDQIRWVCALSKLPSVGL
jgi:hypothetical protein